MKISPEILVGIKRIGNLSLINDENFDKLLNEISSYLRSPLDPQHCVNIPLDTTRIDTLKECYGCLLTFMVEGVRMKEEPSTLKSLLSEHKVPEGRTEKILKVYTEQKLPVELSLKQYNSDPPHIFDVTWKMNFCEKSSFSDFDGKALYFIDLTIGKRRSDSGSLLDDKGIEKISFVCSVNQLQSFVASLKAAVRHLEALAEYSK